MPSAEFLEEFYNRYPQVEEAFQAELDKSLNPRGRELLFDMVAALALAPGSRAVDAGCGEGRYAIELAQRFGLAVHGIDPVPAHIAICNQRLAKLAGSAPEAAGRIRFELGAMEELHEADGSIDLIWCRDVMVHVAAIDRAFAECHRVLRSGGQMLLYQQFATERLEPREAAWLWETTGAVAGSTDPRNIETAYTRAGFEPVETIELRSEWMERREEEGSAVGRQLLHAARLLRAPEKYSAAFGSNAYNIMLGDCFWHIYQMIGKLSPRVYLLKKAA